ncbi:MAG: hypothetical protein ACI9MS_003562 [Glaciecola sp.]|jgi:hypothetical protein
MKTAILILSTLLSFSIFADEKPIASNELIAELKQFCSEVAEEDGIGELDLSAFLLVCVNQELDEEGYQPIKKLD